MNREGFLVLSDNKRPSLVTLITEEPVTGSWFGHPRGALIYNTASALSEEPGYVEMKLIEGKYTYVAPSLRDAAYSLAMAKADWQLAKITPAAKRLLREVEKKGTLKPPASARKEFEFLEKRLLVAGAQEHTESGRHVKILLSWQARAKELGHNPKRMPLPEALRAWELRLLEFNRRHGTDYLLPWQKRRG